jgi:hypothetical protein
MEMNRRHTLSVLGLAAAATALPASAARASTSPKVGAGSSVTDNGCLWAIAQCAVPVVSVRARLLTADRTTELVATDLALMPGESATDGRWESPPLTGIPLGNHWVEVEATSEDGGVGTVSRVCVLWITATVAITVTPTVVDDDHRVVTVNGTAMGRHPLTGVVAPVAGKPVTIRCLYYPIPLPDAPPLLIVTSAPDGSFTADLTLAGNALIQAEVGYSPWDTLMTYSVSPQIQVTTDIRSSRLTAEVADTGLNSGESTTVEGRLEGLADGQWRPLSCRVILIGFVTL